MTIIYPHLGRRKKRKPTEAERKLRAEWERILGQHSKPLEQGSKARGALPGAKPGKVKTLATGPQKRQTPVLPSVPMTGAATKPAIDPLAAEKHALKARLGQSYNKGTVQYLTDDELAEQRTGVHKRR